MINLYSCNNSVFIFDLKDYEVLRKTYRIIGKISGITLTTVSLPVILLPEEVYLLVNENIGKIVSFPDILKEPDENVENKFQKFTEELFKEEQSVYKEIRRKELEEMIDKIIKGKEQKNTGQVLSKEEILEEELQKSGKIGEDNMVWPIVTKHYSNLTGVQVEVPLTEVLKDTTKEKCKVFFDLWKKGYYITSGNKFGGDFLLYLGDPGAFHAVYIVHCVPESECSFHPCELVALGRLSTSVKKRTIFAIVNSEGNIIYYTLRWFDSE